MFLGDDFEELFGDLRLSGVNSHSPVVGLPSPTPAASPSTTTTSAGGPTTMLSNAVLHGATSNSSTTRSLERAPVGFRSARTFCWSTVCLCVPVVVV